VGPLYHYYPDCCCIVPVVCTPFFCMMYDLKTKWVAVCLESAGVREVACDGDSRLSHVLDSKIALTLKVDLICGNIICLIIFCLYPCTVSIFLALSRCFAACFVCDGVFGIMGNIYSEVWCALCRLSDTVCVCAQNECHVLYHHSCHCCPHCVCVTVIVFVCVETWFCVTAEGQHHSGTVFCFCFI